MALLATGTCYLLMQGILSFFQIFEVHGHKIDLIRAGPKADVVVRVRTGVVAVTITKASIRSVVPVAPDVREALGSFLIAQDPFCLERPKPSS